MLSRCGGRGLLYLASNLEASSATDWFTLQVGPRVNHARYWFECWGCSVKIVCCRAAADGVFSTLRATWKQAALQIGSRSMWGLASITRATDLSAAAAALKLYVVALRRTGSSLPCEQPGSKQRNRLVHAPRVPCVNHARYWFEGWGCSVKIVCCRAAADRDFSTLRATWKQAALQIGSRSTCALRKSRARLGLRAPRISWYL